MLIRNSGYGVIDFEHFKLFDLTITMKINIITNYNVGSQQKWKIIKYELGNDNISMIILERICYMICHINQMTC